MRRVPHCGALALVVAAGGALTGVFLGLNYAPTLERAHDSVAFIENEVTWGAFLRALHHWAGHFAIVLGVIHGARRFWSGAYKAPPRVAWVLGVAIFLVLVAFAYTGYLLPGDERAYAGLTVMEEVAGATPVVGESASRLVKGGPEIASVTLARVYTVHTVVLPALLVALVAALVAVRRKRDPDASVLRDLHRDAFAAVVAMLLVATCAWLLPPALGAKLDPAQTSPDAKPEWFLLWANELLYRVDGATFLIAGVLPNLLVGLALGAPFLLRGRERAPRRRVLELAFVVVVVLALAGLTTAAALRPPAVVADDEEEAEPAPPPRADTTALDEAAAKIMRRFRCAQCHNIDGEGGDSAPVLWRDGGGHLPPFKDLYTRTFFRLKVGDPAKFWSNPNMPDVDLQLTGMTYRKRAGLPTKEDLDVLERWFFKD